MPSRQEITEWIQALGGTVKGSVTKDTDFLVVGEGRGDNKYHDALRKGVPIIPWEMFVALGFTENTGDYKLDPALVDPDLIRSAVLLMAHITDGVYAHLVTTGDPRGLVAFHHGRAAVDRVLQAAWGSGDLDLEGGSERDSAVAADRPGALRAAVASWLALVKTLEDM